MTLPRQRTRPAPCCAHRVTSSCTPAACFLLCVARSSCMLIIATCATRDGIPCVQRWCCMSWYEVCTKYTVLSRQHPKPSTILSRGRSNSRRLLFQALLGPALNNSPRISRRRRRRPWGRRNQQPSRPGGVPGTRLRSRDTTRHLLQRAPKTLASNGTNARALVAQLCQKPTSLLPGFLVASVVPDIRPCACRPAPACLSCLGRDMGARLFDKQEASGVASIYPLTFANRQHRTRHPSDGQGVCCKHKETTSVAVSGWNQDETCIDAPGCHIR